MRPLATLAALAALAAPLPAAAQDAEAGRDLYRQNCVACHGPTAGGNGPMAEILAVPTPNLRLLAQGNGGRFPLYRVAARIDGRDPLLAHGGPMPLFGSAFEGEDVALKTDTGQPMLTSRPIADLLAFLELIQE